MSSPIGVSLTQQVCRKLINVLSKERMDRGIKEELSRRIGDILLMCNAPEDREQLSKRYKFEELNLEDLGESRDYLTVKIIQDLTRTPIRPEHAEEMQAIFDLLVKKTIRQIGFPGEKPMTPEELQKEGRAKQYEREVARRAVNEEHPSFADLDPKEISISLLSDTFAATLKEAYRKQYHHIFTDGKTALSYLNSVFEKVLNELTDEVVSQKLTPENATKQFLPRFLEQVKRGSVHREMIDRETFQLLTETAQTAGKETPLTKYNSNVEDLKKAIKEGTWRVGEERELVNYEITESEKPRVYTLLENINPEKNQAFRNCLIAYFQNP